MFALSSITIFSILALAVVSIIGLSLGVFLQNRQGATHRIFIILGLVTSCWLVLTYLSALPQLVSYYLITARLTIFFAVPQSVLFFLLAHTIPDVHLRFSHRKLIVGAFSTFCVMALVLTPFVFEDVSFVNGRGILKVGMAMPVFVGWASIFSIGALVVLVQKIIKTRGIEKRQLVLMLSGILLMLGLIIFTIMIPVVFFKNDSGIAFAPVYALIFITMTGIAILRYHLFNIKLIATESLLLVVIFSLLVEGIAADSLLGLISKTTFAVFIAAIGVSLAKSVKKEITQREQLAVLNTSLEQSNEQLKSANLRLEQLDRQKTEFLSIASHQLRTPLSIINGYVELLSEGGYGKMPKESLLVFESITENTEHLIKLINEFLDITHIEQGKTKFFFEQVDLSGMVTKVVDEVRSQIKERSVSLVWKPTVKPLLVDVDKDKMRDMIFNLVDNAVKYTEKGTVEVSLSVVGEQVNFSVKDQGLGFEEIDRVNFFQKFYRGKNVEGVNVTGTGLGLYVVKKFVEGHLGTISATSPGLHKGSEFSFLVPLHHAVISPPILIFPDKDAVKN